MVSKEPLPVSIVVPAYNGEAFISDAMRSIYAQSHLPREIIVVDDASTDRTLQRVQQEATRAPTRVRLIRLSKNSGGPALPINLGVQAAKSPVIAVLDQDDVFLPNKLVSQVSVLTANPDVAFVFGHFDLVQAGASCRGKNARQGAWQRGVSAASERQQRPLLRQMHGAGNLFYCDANVALRVLLRHGNCIGGFPSFSFRRADWLAIGRLDERLIAATDYDFLCRLCRTGRIAMIPDVHYQIRRHGDHLSDNSILCCTDEVETLMKFSACAAWSSAAQEVRRLIASRLYRLAVLLAESGSAIVARRLLMQSLLLGGLHPRAVLRAVEYPIKVYRRKQRGNRRAITGTDRTRVACVLQRVVELYGGHESRRVLNLPRIVDRMQPHVRHGECITAACRERGSI